MQERLQMHERVIATLLVALMLGLMGLFYCKSLPSEPVPDTQACHLIDPLIDVKIKGAVEHPGV